VLSAGSAFGTSSLVTASLFSPVAGAASESLTGGCSA